MTRPHPRHPTILHALLASAEQGHHAPTVTLAHDTTHQETLRHDTLLNAAARTAAALAEHGIRPGDRIVLCLPTAAPFTTAFLGTQLLGATPTAIAVPARLGGAAGFESQLKDLLDYLRPAALITTPTVITALPHPTDTRLINADTLHTRALDPTAPTHPLNPPHPDTLALIQCTSGSTGTPKGVQITHANLAANCEQFTTALHWTPHDTTVSWAPLYHDMGLITGLMCPLYAGADTVLMPPTRFLRAPTEWLHHITTHHGTIAAAPNFAYGYLTTRVNDDDLNGIDLSTWRIALCGAEPVKPATIKPFIERFTRWGLPPNAFTPAYGMAEATLVITTTHPDTPLTHDSINRHTAATHHTATDTDPNSPDALHIVDCGPPLTNTRIRITDTHNQPLPDNHIGHIQFQSPSQTTGYHNLPHETTNATTPDGWWKTGDIGYLRNGNLRITGRAKDLIIIRGANYYPTDIEHAAETVPGIRPGAVIALAHQPDHTDTEELHLIAETELHPTHHHTLRQAIHAAITTHTGIHTTTIHLVPKRAIPKTTSGKLQRTKARELFLHTTPPTTKPTSPDTAPH
ncbi:AMP-binding protein [Kitasatospora sp. RG8]|uniref:AMP-binding protein n=1 Tax=Kitasatospora sp. RG8 TaxID=2820815 RepID=UPI001ADFAA4C|nr:AMP-binding protein [Kitasatospora sp. RG8]MBP0455146.1 AMP-binding protein [Kitasatospora sp. RG8]